MTVRSCISPANVPATEAVAGTTTSATGAKPVTLSRTSSIWPTANVATTAGIGLARVARTVSAHASAPPDPLPPPPAPVDGVNGDDAGDAGDGLAALPLARRRRRPPDPLIKTPRSNHDVFVASRKEVGN